MSASWFVSELSCQRVDCQRVDVSASWFVSEMSVKRSAHTSLVNVCLISGTLDSTPLPWLPVLSNIEPPALQAGG